jgi:4-aminobutyrate--pyruvate transaminase
MTVRPNSIASRDVAYVVHAYTNLRRHEQDGPMVISKGKGIHVYDENGKEYIEGLAGLWCAGLGFDEKRLVKAATEQMEKLPFYHTFASKANEPTALLAEKLVSHLPKPLAKVFFANSGSEANDTAVKMVWYYNNALGRPEKKKIISRQKGYHGVTVAAASLTGLAYAQNDFDIPIKNILHTGCPHFYRFGEEGESEEAFAQRRAKELEDMILAEGPETVAAFIGEPVMGAGGVITPPKGYWEAVQKVCRKYDVLVICDEVICGFGRTGNWFGANTYNIVPDIMTMAKQLSAAYMPISAVGISQKVYDVIADNSNKRATFGHGYTYSAHPVPAAVALETLKIYEERDIVSHVKRVGPYMQEQLRKRFANHPLVGEVRGVGLIAAVEMVADRKTKALFDPAGKVGAYIANRATEHGLIIRPLVDALGFCPPMIITEKQIDQMLDRFAKALDDGLAFAKSEGLAKAA